jgi:hypothetical protein
VRFQGQKPLIPIPLSTTTEKHQEANKWNRDKKVQSAHTCLKAKRRAL